MIADKLKTIYDGVLDIRDVLKTYEATMLGEQEEGITPRGCGTIDTLPDDVSRAFGPFIVLFKGLGADDIKLYRYDDVWNNRAGWTDNKTDTISCILWENSRTHWAAFDGWTKLQAAWILGTDGKVETTSLSVGFNGCTSLESVYIDPSYKNIGYTNTWDSQTFKDCTSLKDVSIEGAIHLGYQTFVNCTSLTNINLPNVKTIGNEAFRNCSSLASIALPKYEWDSANKSEDAFRDCTALTTVSDLGKTTSLGNYMFRNCTALTEINLPDTIKTLGTSCFANCKNLVTINNFDKVEAFPANSRLWGGSTYMSFSGIDGKLALPNLKGRLELSLDGTSIVALTDLGSITSVWNLSDMRALKFVRYPSTVQHVGQFWRTAINTIIVLAPTPPTVSWQERPKYIYVPDNVVDDYKEATGWSDVASIIYPLSEYDGEY